jgi:CrcB protein
MQKLFWIGAAGALGTMARYGLSNLFQRVVGFSFPWGTLAVNVLGCFLFGVVWSLAEDRLVISGETRLIFLVGFMGAFSTFSTFMFETGALLREYEWAAAAINLLGQNALGLAFLLLGQAAGRLVAGG